MTGLRARSAALMGAILGGLAVAAGALGAHALRTRLSSDSLAVFETAVRYQMAHALALLFVASLLRQDPTRAARWAATLFAGGVVLFSGSLYVLAFGPVPGIGILTPLGGLLLLAGWIALAVALLRGAPPRD